MSLSRIACAASVALGALVAPLTSAQASLVLSQLVVELSPGDHSRSDLELLNQGPDRAYVVVQPREIVGPGTAGETSRQDPDPEKLGLLVSPARLILEPGQRRLIRIADIAPPADRERVYRVTVKPVAGQVSSAASGLKVLVGYDVLVLVRPGSPEPHVSGVRHGNQLMLRNDGNVSVELADGEQCDSSNRCKPLPEGRLYAGASKTVTVAPGARAAYKLKVGAKVMAVQF